MSISNVNLINSLNLATDSSIKSLREASKVSNFAKIWLAIQRNGSYLFVKNRPALSTLETLHNFYSLVVLYFLNSFSRPFPFVHHVKRSQLLLSWHIILANLFFVISCKNFQLFVQQKQKIKFYCTSSRNCKIDKSNVDQTTQVFYSRICIHWLNFFFIE